jgi:cytochrome P450
VPVPTGFRPRKPANFDPDPQGVFLAEDFYGIQRLIQQKRKSSNSRGKKLRRLKITPHFK